VQQQQPTKPHPCRVTVADGVCRAVGYATAVAAAARQSCRSVQQDGFAAFTFVAPAAVLACIEAPQL
jgi:hypothetical protein